MPEDANQSDARPSPDVMRGVIPDLDLNGRAAVAADFYARAFVGQGPRTDAGREQPGRHLHIQVEVNGGALMMTDGMSTEARPGPQGMHLQLVVAGGAAWWARAVEAGCTVEAPYERQFWGDTWGLLRDPFGVAWAVLETDGQA